MWISKKKLKQENEYLQSQLDRGVVLYNEAMGELVELSKLVETYRAKYPFEMGQVVYDVQLRSDKGRFTKTKACREYSIVNEVVVDKKNYFNLVERLANKDVFLTLEAAEAHLKEVCVN